MGQKRLIVNADDLGLSRRITDGILLAHQRGIVTSASFMVDQPASDYTLEQLRHVPKLDVGIHLNLCQGSPVLPPSEVPTLVTRQGKFYSPQEIIRKLWRWQVSPREIEAEFRAQIGWMKARGLAPTHADSHHRLHEFPPSVRAFRRALVTEGIRRVRAPRARYWPRDGYIGGPYSGPLLRRLLVTAYNGLLQFVAFRKFLMPDCRAVLHPRYRGKLDLLPEAWAVLLENLPPGTYEMICHPGLSEPGLSESDLWSDWAKRRELELQILTDPQLRLLMERNEIELIAHPELEEGDDARRRTS